MKYTTPNGEGSINRPDAVDIDTMAIRPSREYEVCNGLLDDFDALNAFYEKNGYLFFRDVLDPDSVVEARDAMLAIAADDFGLIDKGDVEAKWTGKPTIRGQEELPCFAGISQRLINYPKNQELLTKILGDKPAMVPVVQYRLYPPQTAVTPVHQDGFFSPGIQDYRPLWIPLTPCPREVGGLTIAVGHNNKGWLHNLARETPWPIPDDEIDPDSWATADFEPGDLLVVHPYAPHASMPNMSDRLRVTFDTRVQSAKNPTTFMAKVDSALQDSVTVTSPDPAVGQVTLSLDRDSFVRTRHPGKREAFEDYADAIQPGQQLVVTRVGDRAAMLRIGSNP
ncbi:phytanoyl-CoA dioxygenase [Novosphingobium malaysiense]|uniref:Phytanoyl-CoA dioxygenase n=2 Tax=Novosphingobium malaysiense TaxID=1348853 RepID=A0A0B1ZJ52_9SPHN|nr:phytanoyl-CoA dioxygenase [Novosphingobium malaysiense]